MSAEAVNMDISNDNVKNSPDHEKELIKKGNKVDQDDAIGEEPIVGRNHEAERKDPEEDEEVIRLPHFPRAEDIARWNLFEDSSSDSLSSLEDLESSSDDDFKDCLDSDDLAEIKNNNFELEETNKLIKQYIKEQEQKRQERLAREQAANDTPPAPVKKERKIKPKREVRRGRVSDGGNTSKQSSKTKKTMLKNKRRVMNRMKQHLQKPCVRKAYEGFRKDVNMDNARHGGIYEDTVNVSVKDNKLAVTVYLKDYKKAVNNIINYNDRADDHIPDYSDDE